VNDFSAHARGHDRASNPPLSRERGPLHAIRGTVSSVGTRVTDLWAELDQLIEDSEVESAE